MLKTTQVSIFVLLLFLLSACGGQSHGETDAQTETPEEHSPLLVGKWIVESNGSVMIDPQTSGLAFWRDNLLSLSDGSAHESQRRRIHVIDPQTAALSPKPAAMKMASRVRRGCFAQYLSDQPDLEAIVVDPIDDNVLYIVTEDATRTGALSTSCQQKFSQTGSTDYPTLLVRVKLADNGDATMTHVRPIQFALSDEVGDFPNDGIEGLAMASDRTLYLGLEKDKAGKARIFKVTLTDDFWSSSAFATVVDAKLQMPAFKGGNHPINGLTWFSPEDTHPGYLFAAARNDDEIWLIDTTGTTPTKQIYVRFAAEIKEESDECGEHEIMDNASIEGIATIGNTLWMVNDPWKRNYRKNINCPVNAPHYEKMSPLLFSMPIAPEWFN